MYKSLAHKEKHKMFFLNEDKDFIFRTELYVGVSIRVNESCSCSICLLIMSENINSNTTHLLNVLKIQTQILLFISRVTCVNSRNSLN